MNRVLLTLAVLVALAGTVDAGFPQVRLEVISDGDVVSPIGMANAGDGSGRLFVLDQRGKIQIISGPTVLPTPFLDLAGKLVPERTGFDERGLLGMAFHPQFASAGADGEGKFYVFYSAPSPDAPGTEEDPVDSRSVIAEYSVTGPGSNVADPSSERILLSLNVPQFNHNGGQLAFGPDGMLYASTGDGGSSNDNNAGHTGGSTARPSGILGNAQDRTNLHGKVLRIDPLGTNGPGGQYGIPSDNPFVGVGNAVREEIWAYGLRNPWRFSFDDGPGGTGRLYLADVGQRDIEEIDLIVKGGNFGWRIKEGSEDFDPTTVPNPAVPLIDPIAEYSREGRSNDLLKVGLAAVGGHVYRGSEFPELEGKYVFADWSTGFSPGNGTLLGLEETSPGVFVLTKLDVEGGNPIGQYINAIGEGGDGALYVLAKDTLAAGASDPTTGEPTGTIYRLVVVPEPTALALLTLGGLGVIIQRRK